MISHCAHTHTVCTLQQECGVYGGRIARGENVLRYNNVYWNGVRYRARGLVTWGVTWGPVVARDRSRGCPVVT